MDSKLIQYLKRIIKTIFVGLLWMAVNVRVGVMGGYAFADNTLTTANIIFYLWFILSLIALLYFFYSVWKKPLNFDE